MALADIFLKEKKPERGLLAAEWFTIAYVVFTLLMMAFIWNKLQNP